MACVAAAAIITTTTTTITATNDGEIETVAGTLGESEDVVRKLILQNRDFDALCQEYSRTGEELEKLAAPLDYGRLTRELF